MSITRRPFRVAAAATGASLASTAAVGVRAMVTMVAMMMMAIASSSSLLSSSTTTTTTISSSSSSSSPFVAVVSALSNHQGPTFSVSEQALFGGYNYGEASLFGGGGSTSTANGNVMTSTTTTRGRYRDGLRWTRKEDSAAAAAAAASDIAQSQTTTTTTTATFYGAQHNTNSHVPFQGEMVESMTFGMPQTMHGVTNIKNKKDKKRSSSSRLKPWRLGWQFSLATSKIEFCIEILVLTDPWWHQCGHLSLYTYVRISPFTIFFFLSRFTSWYAWNLNHRAISTNNSYLTRRKTKKYIYTYIII